MRARVAFTLALGLVALTVTPRPAAGFCLHAYTGFKSQAKWKETPVNYRVSSNVTDANVLAAIDKAFQIWAQVDCGGLSFNNDGTFDLAQTNFQVPGFKGISVFWFDDATGFPIDPKFYATSFSGHDNDGGIAFASVAINGFGFKWNTSGGDAQNAILDVQNELVYLVGTVIGLADSTAADSVMKPGGQFGSTARYTLKQDDKDAVVYHYPKDVTCQAPAPAADCVGATPPPADGGSPPAGDGGSPPIQQDGGGSTPTGDGGGADGPSGGGDGGGDGGVVNAGDGATGTADDGCSCSMDLSSPERGWVALGILMALALCVLARRSRRGGHVG